MERDSPIKWGSTQTIRSPAFGSWRHKSSVLHLQSCSFSMRGPKPAEVFRATTSSRQALLLHEESGTTPHVPSRTRKFTPSSGVLKEPHGALTKLDSPES